MSFRRAGRHNASSTLSSAHGPLDAVRGSGKPLDHATFFFEFDLFWKQFGH